MSPCLCCWIHILGGKLSPSELGLGFPYGYSIDDKNLEDNFRKLIQEHSGMFEGFCCLICCKSPKGDGAGSGLEGALVAPGPHSLLPCVEQWSMGWVEQ